MKRMFAIAALAALAWPAAAGGDCSQAAEYRCENSCPLAVQANELRSFGTEAYASSLIARADVSKVVVSNLARI